MYMNTRAHTDKDVTMGREVKVQLLVPKRTRTTGFRGLHASYRWTLTASEVSHYLQPRVPRLS